MFRVGALSASGAHWGRALPQHWVIVWGYYASVWHRFSEGETFAVFVPNLKCSMTANVMKNQGWAATQGMLLSLLVTTLFYYYLFMSFRKIPLTWYVVEIHWIYFIYPSGKETFERGCPPPKKYLEGDLTNLLYITFKADQSDFFYYQLSQ